MNINVRKFCRDHSHFYFKNLKLIIKKILTIVLMNFQTLQPEIIGHYPAGSSCQAMLHYLQEINTGKFQQYDEGTILANMRRYGTAKPPEYDLSKVKVPIYLHYGLNDYLAATEVCDILSKKLYFLKHIAIF